GSGKSGSVERAAVGCMRCKSAAHDPGQERVYWRTEPGRRQSHAPAGGGRLCVGRSDRCTGGRRARTREGEDQLVFGAGVAWAESEGRGLSVGDRDQPWRPAHGKTRAVLRPRSSGIESGALPGCVGEEARSDERIDAVAAMAAGGAMARMPGPDLGATGSKARVESRHARDDRAGTGRAGERMGASHWSGSRGTAHRSNGCRGGAAYTAHARCAT